MNTTFLLLGLSCLNLCLILVLILRKKPSQLEQNKDQWQALLQQESKANRQELGELLQRQTIAFNQQIQDLRRELAENGSTSRMEQAKQMNYFSERFRQSVEDLMAQQRENFALLERKQDQLVGKTEQKLEQMRITVDEKLHKTLEQRLGESFRLVSERLEAVQRGLGEMQNLATGVGDLKKVLSNVKTRGVLGEIQLGNLLEQVMAPEQYDQNVKTKKGSNDLVEFAIKLPGKDDQGEVVYLPVDAKFPQEDYIRLQDAYDQAHQEGIESAQRALIQSIKKFAKDIRDKYIDPPYTTDFGIMFLPVEGLFAEVARHPDLIAELQRQYKIIVTGPTTLAAMLNSLQMGFRTLAIQKRSSEVWKILGAVKSEFGKFGDVLAKAQKKISEANQEIDTLVGTRTRMMQSKLRQVEALPTAESQALLDDGGE